MACVRARSRAWQAENPEKVRASEAACYLARKAEILARGPDYSAANREKNRARHAAWRSANPDKVRANVELHRAANLDKNRAREAASRLAAREKIRGMLDLIARLELAEAVVEAVVEAVISFDEISPDPIWYADKWFEGSGATERRAWDRRHAAKTAAVAAYRAGKVKGSDNG